MAYDNHFKHADDVITHLNTVVPAIADPLLQAKYVGFVAVVAVTVYELAIKEVFINFGAKKHKVFGAFTQAYFYRLNGRIKVKELKTNIERFGDKYKNRFDSKLEIMAKDYLHSNKREIKSSYGNLITWRNEFAHEGRIKTNATYDEATQSYEDGKVIIHCLAETMVR